MPQQKREKRLASKKPVDVQHKAGHGAATRPVRR
jgi:hypothetical protein